MKPILQKSFMDLHECNTIEHYVNLRILNNRVTKQRKEDKKAIFYAIILRYSLNCKRIRISSSAFAPIINHFNLAPPG